ncbi:ATP-binding protein [bacterium]|nr:ATP-binding protein [bacterium]
MNNNKDTLVGKVISINGNRISVKMSESLKSTMPIINGLVYRVGQIGSFLRIPLGYANLYGIVTQVGADAIPESLKEIALQEYERNFSTRWMSLVLVGERVGNKFERGVTQFPTAEDEVHLVTLDDLNIIYGGFDENNSITVGNISVSESLPAKIELDKLVTRHCAIVGSTGSGKSNTVAVMLESIAKGEFKSARILLIDPHGEYDETLNNYSKVFKVKADKSKGQSELHIPFWALPFDELMRSFPGNLNDQQKDYVRAKILEKKINSIQYLKNKPNEAAITSDSPIPFSLKQLWFELDDFERQTFRENRKPETVILKSQGNPDQLKSNEYEPASLGSGSPFLNLQAKGILGFLDGMRNRIIDQRFKFLYEPGGFMPDLTGKVSNDLDYLLLEWLGHDKTVTILDLSGVPSIIMSSISGSLLKIMYDALFWGQNLPVGGRKQPLLLVLEEAHSYLKAGENSISSRTIQTIAKEGRKYGVGLLLVTQRPTELDETVLSQCGTLIALRMTNKGDRGHVSAAVQDELCDMMALLPSLRTGEGLIMGEGVKIPSRVKFEKISKAPRSVDPEVSKEWRKERPDRKESDFETTVDLWRNQKLN